MALVSLCIGTGSQGPALVDNPINTKASDFVLMRAVKAETSLCIFKTRRILRCFEIPYHEVHIFPIFSLLRAVNVLARLYNSLSFRSSKMSKLLSGRFSAFSVRSKGSCEAVYTFVQARLIHRYLAIV